MKLKGIIGFTILLSMCSGSIFATRGKGKIKGIFITFNKVQVIYIYLIPVLLPFNFSVGCLRENKVAMRDIEAG